MDPTPRDVATRRCDADCKNVIGLFGSIPLFYESEEIAHPRFTCITD